MVSINKIRALVLLSASFIPVLGARAQQVESGGSPLLSSPKGLMISSTSSPGKQTLKENAFGLSPQARSSSPKEETPAMYGATSPDANWSIGQEDIPEALPPFKNNFTQNKYASVKYLLNGDFELSQNAAMLPCQKIFPSGKKAEDEFDLFVGSIPQYYKQYPKTFIGERRPLTGLKRIIQTASLELTSLKLVDSTCPITRAVITSGLVLTNLKDRQTFFYQLSYAIYQKNNGRLVAAQLNPAWFFTGTNKQIGSPNQFGYGDRIWSSYALSPAVVGLDVRYKLNVLPRLKQLIAQGAKFGMDQDLSHWAITGAYYGQSAFGHVAFATRWNNLSLTTFNQ